MTTATTTQTWTCPRENVRRMLSEMRADRLNGTPAKDPAAYAKHAREMFARRALPVITPASVRVGMGATWCLWTDSHAVEVIAVSKTGRKITLRGTKRTIDPSFKPEIIPGGFVGHCVNQDDQKWVIESDPAAGTFVAHWSAKRGKFMHGSSRVYVHAVGQGSEYHDYNF